MKIMVNYDLIDKAREAKTGFSLNKYVFVVGFTNALVIPAMLLGACLGNKDLIYVLDYILKVFGYTIFYNMIQFWFRQGYCKERAMTDLNELSVKLGDICFNTDAELLKDAYKYDVKYELNLDTFPPEVMQKKYIMVPIYNEWGNNERSLLQEHVIGKSSYALSYGEPEEKKIRTYVRSRTLNNGR